MPQMRFGRPSLTSMSREGVDDEMLSTTIVYLEYLGILLLTWVKTCVQQAQLGEGKLIRALGTGIWRPIFIYKWLCSNGNGLVTTPVQGDSASSSVLRVHFICVGAWDAVQLISIVLA
eukprot:1139742-Pelagomonas_calceolata.AAC.2